MVNVARDFLTNSPSRGINLGNKIEHIFPYLMKQGDNYVEPISRLCEGIVRRPS